LREIDPHGLWLHGFLLEDSVPAEAISLLASILGRQDQLPRHA
jgi:hypothetical protein